MFDLSTALEAIALPAERAAGCFRARPRGGEGGEGLSVLAFSLAPSASRTPQNRLKARPRDAN